MFISHRYGRDKALYDDVLQALSSQGHFIQDISLSEDAKLTGPRGGDLPKIKLQAEIAARIYTADLLIAPSRPATSRSAWVTWEVQLAAIGYGVPVLFVRDANIKSQTWLVTEIAGLGLPSAIADRKTDDIVRSAIQLIDGRPDWGVRESESDPHIRFRGPPRSARDDVLRKFPFRARLDQVEAIVARPKPSFWNRIIGKPTPDPSEGRDGSN